MPTARWPAVPNLLPDEFRVTDKDTSKDAAVDKKEARRQRRVTFLVNIWLNFHPLNVHPFPDTMMDKMSGGQLTKRARLHFAPRAIVADVYEDYTLQQLV